MSKKIIAILMALALILSFAACGGKDDTPTEAPTEAPVSEEAPSEEASEATSEDASEATSEEASEATSEEASEIASDPTSAVATQAPQTKEEIVEYFNKSVNTVKSDATAVTRNYSKITINGSLTLPKAVSGILKLLGGADKFIGDQLAKNSKGSETFKGKDAIKKVYPVENEDWASVLTAADVKSATCTEANGKYTITIVTLPDAASANVKHGKGHAPKAFNAVPAEIVNDNIPGVAEGIVGTATMSFPSCTAKIVVDAATGKVLTAHYDLCWTINFEKVGVILPFMTSDDFTVTY